MLERIGAFVRLAGELTDGVRRARVGPGDGVTKRLAGLARPHDRRLTLIRDAWLVSQVSLAEDAPMAAMSDALPLPDSSSLVTALSMQLKHELTIASGS